MCYLCPCTYFSDTFVMKMTATDADEEGTLHTKISYTIVQESHTGMFYINRHTGQIFVMNSQLDREVYSH